MIHSETHQTITFTRLTNNSFPQNDYHAYRKRPCGLLLSQYLVRHEQPKKRFRLSHSAVTWPDSLAYDTRRYICRMPFSQHMHCGAHQTASLDGISFRRCHDLHGSGRNLLQSGYSSSLLPSDLVCVNHAVTIVGWDDTYTKENFTDQLPVCNNDGAWIVKNSYGTNWGENGYFYLSYEDQSITNLVSNTAVTHPCLCQIIIFTTVHVSEPSPSLPATPSIMVITMYPMFSRQLPDTGKGRSARRDRDCCSAGQYNL